MSQIYLSNMTNFEVLFNADFNRWGFMEHARAKTIILGGELVDCTDRTYEEIDEILR